MQSVWDCISIEGSLFLVCKWRQKCFYSEKASNRIDMKKIFLLSLLVLTLSVGHAQVSNNSFTVMEGLSHTGTIANASSYENTVHIRNDKSDDLEIGWRQVTPETYVANWNYQLCDHQQCIILPTTNKFFPTALRSGNEGFLKLQVYSDTFTTGLSELTFRVWDIEDSANTSVDIAFSLNSMVSVSPSQLAANVAVFPNPAVNDRLFIAAKEGRLDKGTISIMDMNGRLLRVKNVSSVEMTDVDVSDLSEGMYLMRYITKDNTVLSRKFLKN